MESLDIRRDPSVPLGVRATRKPLGWQRAEFLRSCRARIQPSELGLPMPQRKRTQGLRREDVAALSGVSVAWYTWLEQGRDMRVSDEVLERICQTFRLSAGERAYLFSLVQQRPPRLDPDCVEMAPPEVARMVEGLPVPAILLNLRWDVLAWNQLNAELFRDYGRMPCDERNLVEILFTGQSLVRDPADFETMARRVLAKIRVNYSKAPNDQKFEALVRRMDLASPVFRRIWRSPEINVGSYGVFRFAHAVHGLLSFEHTSYVPDGHPGLTVTICMPTDAATWSVVDAVRLRNPGDCASSQRAG